MGSTIRPHLLPAAVQRLGLVALALLLGTPQALPTRAQDLPMQSQPATRRQFIRERELRPAQSGNQTIQQLDDLLQQQQRQVTPQGTLQDLNQLEQRR